MKLFFDDSHEYIGGYGAPDLRLDCVLAGSQKTFDAQVLLDPLEKQFDLSSTLVQGADCQRRQARIVGQKHQRFARLGIFEADAS